MNYFDVLGIKKCFSIDEEDLAVKYLQIQKKHHPDNFSDIAEKIKNIDFSSSANIAYTAIIDEEKRIEHLLSLENINLENSKNLLDLENLEEILCDMESIDGIENESKNNPNYLDKNIIIDKNIIKILDKRESSQKLVIKCISDYFDFQIGQLKSVTKSFAEYRYNTKIINKIKKLNEKFSSNTG